jgi:hypothetical protein
VLEKKGELIELELAAPVAREPKGEREIFYAMLAHYSRSRGYKAGWPAVNFQERYGYFPNALLRRLTPIPPDQETMVWIQTKLQNFAQSITSSMDNG